MATYSIFQHSAGNSDFEVWVTDGLLQFLVNGEIRHDITSVEDFLIEAAKAINKPNGTDDTIVESTGSISDAAVENFDGGPGVALDTNGTNPSISLQDDDTTVKISGSGVGGSLTIDFGTGETAQTEASLFSVLANDLLGKAQTIPDRVETVQIGDYTRNVTISTRDDDVHQIKFKSTGDAKDLSWADIYIEDLAFEFGGVQTDNGNVNDLSYSANQLNIDGNTVNLGPQGVGGKEAYLFADEDAAEAFFNEVESQFGADGDRREIINEAIKIIAEGLGGVQTKNGNVSLNYKASQIKLTGDDKDMVDLGNHGVGGKEVYQFDSQETAQKFIDQVRDAVGVEAHDGKLVDEFVFKVSGGAGISGSPTFVGKDAFIEFIGEEFGGDQIRDGSVSEGYSGGAKLIGDMTEVQLGPSGVGGKEIWDFDNEATALAFIQTLDDLFG